MKPYTRVKDLQYIAKCIEENNCCAITGLSNMGKSTLLRQIRTPGAMAQYANIQDEALCFFYIDFNLQLQMTGQGFYELILRTILNRLHELDTEQNLINQVQEAYDQVVAPTDEFQNALSFNQAIIALCERWSRRLVLLCDEFDEVYHGMDPRVFLNLRALRDRYPTRLLYLVVVGKRLFEHRQDKDVSEFAELFAHNNYYICPLDEPSVRHIVQDFSADVGVKFTKDDIDFIMLQSGGHPGLLGAICQIMAYDLTDSFSRDRRLILTHLTDNINIRVECAKLWNGIAPERQTALLEYLSTGDMPLNYERDLIRKGVLVKNKKDRFIIFSKLFEDFVRRQQLVQDEPESGVIIDIDSGEVYVDGQNTELLTSLEYRLLLLLYGHIDQICDKYRIVEAVWGEDYIEEVDDARIEKLVSRLRQKIEPTPSEPKYIITVRGRGYRLQSKQSTT